MATLNPGRAVGTLTSFRYIKMVGLIFAGSVLARMGQDWLVNNVYDVPFAGGDIVYSAVMAAVYLTFVGGRNGTYLAAGAGLGGASAVADELGI